MGRRCDQCAENFASMDELGCKGEFSPSQLIHPTEAANLKKTFLWWVHKVLYYSIVQLPLLCMEVSHS